MICGVEPLQVEKPIFVIPLTLADPVVRIGRSTSPATSQEDLPRIRCRCVAAKMQTSYKPVMQTQQRTKGRNADHVLTAFILHKILGRYFVLDICQSQPPRLLASSVSQFGSKSSHRRIHATYYMSDISVEGRP